MCGIAGILMKESDADQALLKGMCHRLALRGPDAEGSYIDNRIGLGHRRLSVIDLETGDQPMFSIDRSVVIVFNGEIYNFKKLRDELLTMGYEFNTKSDTEVLINCYLAYGMDTLLNRIEGMFAFALYDKKQERLYLARDKFGEKPLYYLNNEDELKFASELKAFDPNLINFNLDVKALNYFLSLTYIPAPFTIYKEIRKLEAGHYLIFNRKLEVKQIKYFDFKQILNTLSGFADFKGAKSYIKESVITSIQQRMVSDVPIGVFLSGGIDSSIVAAVMSRLSGSPVNTFTIGFNEKSYDESHRAKVVADAIKSNHSVHFLDYKDVVSLIDEIILHYDEPFGDSSAIPSYYVAKLAREKVKVVLTGDCADELFGGYEKYLIHYYADKYNRLPHLFRALIKKIVFSVPHNRLTDFALRKTKKVISNSALSEFDMHYNLMSLGFNDPERAELLDNKWYYDIKEEIGHVYYSSPGKTALEKSQYTDIKIVLEGDMFVKTDRISMKNSLETRAPFIDSNIVNAVFNMPSNFKIRGGKKKFILKEAFKEYLPAKTLKYTKKGFGVPVDYWFRNELKSNLKELIDPEFIEKQGVFKYSYVKKLFDEHQSGKENHKGKLWNLYVFQKWYIAHSTF